MHGSERSAQTVRFGIFEADLQTGELYKNGIKVPLQGQPFQVCSLLLEHAGELVTREELRQRVWPEDTFVDFEQALNTAIAKIRLALGDEADNPRFVQTLPRRGYRFIAPVEEPASRAPSPSPPKTLVERFRARWISIGVGAALFALLSGIGIWWFAGNRAEAPLPPVDVEPLAGLPGYESEPAFSPDGNQVAFVFHGEDNGGIYTTMVGGERALRLTSNSGGYCPRWSPDGRQVAFSRSAREGVDIYVIPSLGGTEHQLLPSPPEEHRIARMPNWRLSGRCFDWSPNGKIVAFSDSQPDKIHAWISLLSVVDSTTRRLTTPPSQNLDYGPAFSPDGSSVAFVRGIVAGVVEDLYVVPTAGGVPKRLTFDNAWIFGPPAWTPDGRDIVFSSMRGGLASLWRVSTSGGTPRRVPGVGVIAAFPSISPRGNQLVYQQLHFTNNFWRLNLKDEKHIEGPPTLAISETAQNPGRAQFSPDGKRIAFESDRLGYAEIWACNSDGSNCGQLTSLRGTAGAVRWSPDGRYIAFEFRPKEHSELYLLEIARGVPRLLATLPGADNGGPSWSRDGKWIYFYSDRGGGPFQLWKMQLTGGPPVQITKNGGVFGAESADGRFLYYSKFDAPGIWRMPLNGGDEIHVLDQPPGDEWWNWALARNGIYFFELSSGRTGVIKFLDFATGQATIISPTVRPPGNGLAITNDGSSILYHENELAESSIMWVKNFR
jgi:Tol biopolymer transport system component/DNA-binding winged helix-turn-helix (wHTH) protein